MKPRFRPAINPVPPDPIIGLLTRKKLREEIAQFKAMLDGQARESTIQAFLASHSYFFNGILRLDGLSPLFSKVKLGHDFEVDFAWFDSGSDGPEWRLVEIESASARHSMFTKAGDPSAALTHAIRKCLTGRSGFTTTCRLPRN